MVDRLPPLNAVKAFEMAGRHLNMANAADALGVSPGAVSQHVHHLEQWLGCRLFVRTNRGLAFTKEGEAYFGATTRALDGIRTASAAISRPAIRKTFLVSITVSFAMKWLMPRMETFRKMWPEVSIQISTVEAVSQFTVSDGDVGLRYGSGDYPGMHSWEVSRDELLLVAAPIHPIFNSEGDLFEMISEHPLMIDQHPKVINDYPDWPTLFSKFGHAPRKELNVREVSQQWMAIEAAINGEGIALVKSSLARSEIAANRLKRININPISLRSGYHLVCLPENKDDPVIKSFREWLTGELHA